MSDNPANAATYWNNVLEEFIPRIGLAANSVTYQQELMKFIAKINDTHANLWSSIAVRPPIGPCQLPVDLRFAEGRPIVLRTTSAAASSSGLQPGDVIEQLDGVAVDDLVNQWRPIYADSNEAARLRDIATYMTRGPCGDAAVVVRRGLTLVTVSSSRLPVSSLNFSATYTHDRPGDAFQMLTSDIAYLKLSSVKAADSAGYIRSAVGTKGLIIDIRNYPSEFVVFTLGQLLVPQPTPFAIFTTGDVTNPGVFRWNPPVTLVPQQPRYSGKIVILVDDVTQSQAEYTTMAFRTAPGAIVMGSTTAGADGNVVTITLPGGLSSYISGLGVFYPDRRPTQRVGIIPDIEVKPTIDGLRAGRDELLEQAMRQITGTTTSSISFSLNDRGAVSLASFGTSSNLSVGYGKIQSETGNTPSGVAILGLRQNNVLVSETSVPATPLIQNGRTFAEISAMVNTGLAIANPNDQDATITFYFTDANGNFGNGTTTIPAKGQIASFLNQSPFNGRSPLSGTFTFTSSLPVAAVGLRGLTNGRGELLITTLPIADLGTPSGTAPLVFPHFADGGGWTTQVVLANPTDNVLTGTIQFRDPSGQPSIVTVNNQTAGSFAYSIPPRSAQTLPTSGAGVAATVGSVLLVPATNMAAPFGLAVFSFRNGGITVSEAGVPAVPAGNAFRLYAEASLSVQTGIAIANTSANVAAVTLELFKLDGSSTGLTKTLSIPPNGQVATFVNQIPEFASALLGTFQGTLRVSSSAPVSVIGLRGRYNERRDFLTATMMTVDEASPPSTAPLFFPHIVDSGGYTTQFILFSARPRQASSGTLSLFGQTGTSLNLTVR
jgi:C-terminal processing protease CtpA/Prc